MSTHLHAHFLGEPFPLVNAAAPTSTAAVIHWFTMMSAVGVPALCAPVIAHFSELKVLRYFIGEEKHMGVSRSIGVKLLSGGQLLRKRGVTFKIKYRKILPWD